MTDAPSPRVRLAPDLDLSTHDQEAVTQFAAFLQMMAGPTNEAGKVPITDETYRYLLGHDVTPVPVDTDHPAVAGIRPPKGVADR